MKNYKILLVLMLISCSEGEPDFSIEGVWVGSPWYCNNQQSNPRVCTIYEEDIVNTLTIDVIAKNNGVLMIPTSELFAPGYQERCHPLTTCTPAEWIVSNATYQNEELIILWKFGRSEGNLIWFEGKRTAHDVITGKVIQGVVWQGDTTTFIWNNNVKMIKK